MVYLKSINISDNTCMLHFVHMIMHLKLTIKHYLSQFFETI